MSKSEPKQEAMARYDQYLLTNNSIETGQMKDYDHRLLVRLST